MNNTNKMVAGFIVGIIGGAVWQNIVRKGVMIILLMNGQSLSSIFSPAKTLGLLTSFGVIIYYTWRARKYDSGRRALGGSLIRVGRALLYLAGISGYFSLIVGNSKETVIKIVLIYFAISIIFFFIGWFIYKLQIEK